MHEAFLSIIKLEIRVFFYDVKKFCDYSNSYLVNKIIIIYFMTNLVDVGIMISMTV